MPFAANIEALVSRGGKNLFKNGPAVCRLSLRERAFFRGAKDNIVFARGLIAR